MDSIKYVGMDVHKETISIAVMNSAGKLVMESILETKAITILQFIHGLDRYSEFLTKFCTSSGKWESAPTLRT